MDELLRRLFSRRSLFVGAAAMAAAACSTDDAGSQAPHDPGTGASSGPTGNEFNQQEIGNAVEDFFGSTAQGAGQAVERVFGDLGKPNAYIAGEEAGGAVAVGLRYGEGWMYRRNAQAVRIYWTGPSVGFDLGANLSKCFILIYNLRDVRDLFQRFPSAEGQYYFIAGVGVNYMQSGDLILAVMRTGVGARAGVNIGYLNFTEEREWVPL